MAQCDTHGRASRHFSSAFPESAGFSQTGCCPVAGDIPDLEADPCPSRQVDEEFQLRLSERTGVGQVDPLARNLHRTRGRTRRPRGPDPARDHRSPAGAEDLPRCRDTTRRPRPPGSPLSGRIPPRAPLPHPGSLVRPRPLRSEPPLKKAWSPAVLASSGNRLRSHLRSPRPPHLTHTSASTYDPTNWLRSRRFTSWRIAPISGFPSRACSWLSNYPKTGCNPRKIQDLRAFSDSYKPAASRFRPRCDHPPLAVACSSRDTTLDFSELGMVSPELRSVIS